MKLEIEIPDWVLEKNLYILSALEGDIELVAYKNKNENWLVKENRCSRCGACCCKWFNSPNPKDPCEQYEFREGKGCCKLDVGIPFNCAIGVSKSPYIPECVVTYTEIK